MPLGELNFYIFHIGGGWGVGGGGGGGGGGWVRGGSEEDLHKSSPDQVQDCDFDYDIKRKL